MAKKPSLLKIAENLKDEKKKRLLSSDYLIALLRRKRYTTAQLCELAGASKREVMDAIREIQRQHILLYQFGDEWGIDKTPAPTDSKPVYTSRPDNTFLFGVCSDQHLGSKYSRLDVLEDLYNWFADEGVDRVFNAGNWIDGEARFNKHELIVHGMDNQIEYMADKYPQRDGIVTYAIAGDDHEGWYSSANGIDIGKHAESLMRDLGRGDWVNVGYMESFIELRNSKTKKSNTLLLQHPGMGASYAISYAPQKAIESFEGGEKPAVLIQGHYHKLWAGDIRNVWTLMAGCFTGNTSVETQTGAKKIRDVGVGEYVLTHTGKYRRVTNKMVRYHFGELIRLNYGCKGRCDHMVTATPEHPFLIKRGAVIAWIPISEVQLGDQVSITTTKCAACAARIPFWMTLCKQCNPMDIPGTDHVDEVRWINVRPERKEQPRTDYEIDGDFAWVSVVNKSRRSLIESRCKMSLVYNLAVEMDESYVAGRTVVHNCTQDQTSFMRKKRISAHVGGLVVKLTQDPDTGAIIRCRPEMARYFNKGYYNNRWSHSGKVVLPARGLR